MTYNYLFLSYDGLLLTDNTLDDTTDWSSSAEIMRSWCRLKGRTLEWQCTLCPHKTNKARKFLSSFYLGLMKFSKIWRTYSGVYSGHNCSCISDEACVILLPETFYCNDILQTETETVSQIEKTGPFDCCCSHQSVVSPSLRLCHGSRRHFEHILWGFHDLLLSVNAEYFEILGL